MKKQLLLTPWFSPDDNPVREGPYEVVEKPPFPPPLPVTLPDCIDTFPVVRAVWETRLGQLGFWVISKRPIEGIPGATQSIQRLLTVIAWRGVLHPRNKLLVPTSLATSTAFTSNLPLKRRAVLL